MISQVLLAGARPDIGQGVLHNAGGQRTEFSAGLRQTHSWFEASHRRQPPTRAALEETRFTEQQRFSTDGQGDIEIGAYFHAVESRRRHTHDFERLPLKSQATAEDAAVARIFPLPESIADYRSGRWARMEIITRG